MKFIIFLCSFFIVAYLTEFSYSATSKIQCHDAATNHYWDAGTKYRPVGQCAEINCSADGKKSSKICPITSAAGAGCTRIPADLKRTYPNCCPKVNCK